MHLANTDALQNRICIRMTNPGDLPGFTPIWCARILVHNFGRAGRGREPSGKEKCIKCSVDSP